MQLFYGGSGGFRLHEQGELEISQTRQLEPADNPQREVITLKVKLDIFCGSYAEGYEKAKLVMAALRTPDLALLWINEAETDTNKQTYLNLPAIPAGVDEPESWGTYHQTLNLTFTCVSFLTSDESRNQSATVVFNPGSGPVTFTLGNVVEYSEHYTTNRFSPLRSARDRAAMQLSVAGFLPGDMTVDLATRRSALLASVALLQGSVNRKQVTWSYGHLSNQVVRVEDLAVKINQAVTGIDWSLTASYTVFPDEASYATAEFTVATGRGRERGQMTVGFQGVIRSQSKSAAETKLGVLRSAVLASWGVTSPALKTDERWSFVSADSDADVTDNASLLTGFLELSFEEEYLVFVAVASPFTTFTMQYALRHSWDWLTLERATTVSGSCFASGTVLTAMLDRADDNLLDAFLATVASGVLTKEDRGLDHEYVDGSGAREQKLDFTASYVSAITGPSGVIEADLTEAVEYSGTRWVVQPLPDAPSVVQNCGIEPGRRTVSGSVTAALAADGIAWAKDRRDSLVTGSYPTPPKIDVAAVYLPGVGSGAGTVRLFKVTFSFGEILPDHPLS